MSARGIREAKRRVIRLETVLVHQVLQALLRERSAEGATRVTPLEMGRVLGLERATEVKTVSCKISELATAGKAADLQMAIARHGAATRGEELGFMYMDGHKRAYFGTRDVQKMHVARLKLAAPPRRRSGLRTARATRCW